MANTFTSLLPTIFAQVLMSLRENAVMPRLVNNYSDGIAGKIGSTVDIPLTHVAIVSDVTPSVTGAPTTPLVPTLAQVKLDKWKESSFAINDKEDKEITAGITPAALKECVIALCHKVDLDLLGLYKDIPGYYGTPGVTPFGQADFLDITDATGIITVLNEQKAPLSPRHLVLNAAAYGKALTRRPLQDASWNGSVDAIIKARLNERLGMFWWMDQNVLNHTSGTGAGYLVNNGGGYAAGVTAITVDTGTGTLVVGDIITFAGQTNTYAVKTGISAAGAGLVISPALKAAVADDAAITVLEHASLPSYAVNLAFHPDAFGFATRPLEAPMSKNAEMMSEVDPVTGVAVTVEIVRQNYQDLVKVSILYGFATIRPELAARLLG